MINIPIFGHCQMLPNNINKNMHNVNSILMLTLSVPCLT